MEVDFTKILLLWEICSTNLYHCPRHTSTKTGIKILSDFLQDPTMFLKPVTEDEVVALMLNLDTSKSSDIYGISSRFLKMLMPKLCI